MHEQTLVEKSESEPKSGEHFDLIIIGAGPGGMSAAICAARAKLKILVVERALPGGETTSAYMVDNYLGFNGILGETLASKMETHMNSYNISYTCEKVENIIQMQDQGKLIRTELGNEYRATAVIIATGLEPKKFNTEFEKKFIGRGISYYAKCDVDYYKDEEVAVIGGGNCACYAADYLSGFVKKVYLIHKTNDIKAVRSLKERILSNPNIETIWDSRVIEAFGLKKIEKIKVQNTRNDQHTWLNVKGVFVYIGRIPSDIPFNINIRVDEDGYIITDEYMRTNIRGVYAVGDIRSKQIRQIPTAVADGMIAAINAERDFFR
jgi:thioredoxin reductase (NADPH)